MVLAFGLVELGFRIAGSDVELQSQWLLTNPYVRLDPDLIVVRPRLLAERFVAPAPPPVILTIGDSYTEGFPVRPERAYPAAMGGILGRRGIAATVRNAGMGDTGPDQQLRLLATHLLPKLQPDVVIWQLYANDLWDNVIRAVYRVDGDRLEPVSGARHWIALRTRVFDLIPGPAVLKIQSRAIRRMLYAFEPRGRAAIDDPLIAGAVTKLALEVREFERLAVAHGFTPYLLLVPPQSFYLRDRDPAFAAAWNFGAHARLAELLDARPIFIDGFLGAEGGDRFFDAHRDPADYGFRHLNERGYARLGLVVARRLLRDGALSRTSIR